MVFHWSLSKSKSPSVSKTRFSILADLNNVVVRMVSTLRFISKSTNPFIYHLVTVPRALIKIGINVTFMFHSFFFNSPSTSKYYLSFHFFNFILWSAGTAKSTILQFLFFFCFLLIVLKSGRLADIRWFVCMSKFHRTPYSLSMPSLGCNALCMVISFLVFWSIRSSTLV